MIAEGEDFHEAFWTEDDDEYEIEVIEDHGKMSRLLVMVHSHGQHVQSDEQHDYHVEFRIGADFENDRLGSPLKIK